MSLQWTNELIEHGAGGPVGRFVPQPKETASQGRPAEVRIHSLLTFFSAASPTSSYFSGCAHNVLTRAQSKMVTGQELVHRYI